MQAHNLKSVLDIGSRALVNNCNKIIVRTHFKKPFSYDDRYMGKFDYHDRSKYPKYMNTYKEEELLDEIHSIKNETVDKPSPFHIVKRIRGNASTINRWSHWVTLRRLNLHSSKPGDIAVIPNTPQFNSLIAKVKHLVTVTPVVLPDGRIPSEKDIGALKLCPDTGKVTIDGRLNLLAERQCVRPFLWQGNLLRSKLRRLAGIHHNHYMR